MRGARNAVGTCLSIQAGERVALIADQASAPVAASLEAALAEHQARTDAVLIEAVAGPADALSATGDPRRARAGGRRHPVRAAAGRRTAGAHGHRRTGRAAPDPLCAHGRRDAADHARGAGGGLPARRSPQPAAVRAHAHGVAAHREDAGRHGLHRHLRSLAGVGEDQRPDQSALLVEPAGGRGVHHAGVGRRHVRLRRDGRRLLQRQVRQPRGHAAGAGDSRRPAGRRALRAARPRSRTSGATATPTRTATASASWRSAPTSGCGG